MEEEVNIEVTKDAYIGTLRAILTAVMGVINAESEVFGTRVSHTGDTYDRALTAFIASCRYAEHLCAEIYTEATDNG